MAEHLEKRFDDIHRAEAGRSGWKATISPGWDGATFDRRINEELVLNPDFGVGPEVSGVFSFDWTKLEARVLEWLKSHHPELSHVRDVAGLFDTWRPDPETNPTRVPRICEILADACAGTLRASQGKAALLREEEDGNVVNLLVRFHPAERDEMLDRFVDASVPYLPTTGYAQFYSDIAPAFSNLLGLKKGDTYFSDRNAALVYERTSEIAAARILGPKGDILSPEPGNAGALILVREITGFPLQHYARLDELHQAYHATPTYTGNNNECHIDYNNSWESLPTIRAINANTYANIRENIECVLLGMVLGWIKWTQGSYYVNVPDRLKAGVVAFRLGSRVGRSIESACEQEPIRSFLVRQWSDWSNRAGPRHWALLYASGMKTWADTRPVFDVRDDRTGLSPLRNCYQRILERAMAKLKLTEDGPRWLEALRSHFARPADEAATAVETETFVQRLERECLRRIAPDVPIYQVLPEQLAQIGRPERNEGSQEQSAGEQLPGA